jgi:hypothetical protein
MKPTPVRGTPPEFKAFDFFRRARQYRDAATKLTDIENGEPNWPKWFLTTHAVELVIRAFIVARNDLDVPPPNLPAPKDHDLVGLYDYAVQYGLARDQTVSNDLPDLSELHKQHYARYPKVLRQVSLISGYDHVVDQLIEDVHKAIFHAD